MTYEPKHQPAKFVVYIFQTYAFFFSLLHYTTPI